MFVFSSQIRIDVAEPPFQELALDCCLLKALAEEVLRRFAPSVTAIADDRHHHPLVLAVVCKHFLERLRQLEKAALARDFAFQDLGLHDHFVRVMVKAQ